MKTWQAVVVGGVVVAGLLKAEDESPGATARSVAELRQAVTPVVQEGVGVVGDGVITVRNEASRQGLNPGAVFTPADPSTTGRDVEEIPGMDGTGG